MKPVIPGPWHDWGSSHCCAGLYVSTTGIVVDTVQCTNRSCGFPVPTTRTRGLQATLPCSDCGWSPRSFLTCSTEFVCCLTLHPRLFCCWSLLSLRGEMSYHRSNRTVQRLKDWRLILRVYWSLCDTMLRVFTPFFLSQTQNSCLPVHRLRHDRMIGVVMIVLVGRSNLFWASLASTRTNSGSGSL